MLLFAILMLGFWALVFTDFFGITHFNAACRDFFTGSYLGALCFYACLAGIAWQSIQALWRCFRPRPVRRQPPSPQRDFLVVRKDGKVVPWPEYRPPTHR